MYEFPQKLEEIKNFLQKQDFYLGKNTRDERLNSAFNEDEIINLISKQFKDIQRSKIRDWFDFAFEENGIFYPVNIKISSFKQADNLDCKLGIYYALTGKIPDFNNGVSWDIYLNKLKENLKPNNLDYYFLIINKNDTKEIFITSLKTLTKLVPNGNNLPFQAKWSENKIPQNKNYEEAKEFILKTFAKSLELRASVYLTFKELFSNYV